jgi:hypothetical protein
MACSATATEVICREKGANQTGTRFIQFDGVQSVPGIELGWNEVINDPSHRLAGDNIDVYRSGGTANRPLEIHDTYIQGAHPSKAAQDAYIGGGHRGADLVNITKGG